jgi:hypothetical protein
MTSGRIFELMIKTIESLYHHMTTEQTQKYRFRTRYEPMNSLFERAKTLNNSESILAHQI